jgi:Lysophospholipase L1 and related esterases
MNISDSNLIKLIQTYNLQQDLTAQAIVNKELESFEKMLKSQLGDSKESMLNNTLFANNESSITSSLNCGIGTNNNQFIYYLSQLFGSLIKYGQLENKNDLSAPVKVADKSIFRDNIAPIHAQNQASYPPPLTSGGYNKLFTNDVFLGDSITKGLSAYHILDEAKVYAEVGIGTKKAKELVDLAAKQNPKRIFIMIGINDVGSYTTGQFANYYSSLINSVKTKCPNAKIYVQTILPVSGQATQKNPSLSNSRINEFNSAILQISKNENVGFINTSALVNENFYARDGIHYKPTFYPNWLNFLKNNVPN